MSWGANYFEMDDDAKVFAQKALFWEYVNNVGELEWDLKEEQSLVRIFCEDLVHYEKDEDYETCQLYKDVWYRFEKEFKEIG